MINNVLELSAAHLLIVALMIAITASMAHGKGRSWIGWAIFALFAPLVALVIVIFIDRKEPPIVLDPHLNAQQNSELLCRNALIFLDEDKIEESLKYAEIAILLHPGNADAADLLYKIKVELFAKTKDSYDQLNSLAL